MSEVSSMSLGSRVAVVDDLFRDALEELDDLGRRDETDRVNEDPFCTPEPTVFGELDALGIRYDGTDGQKGTHR